MPENDTGEIFFGILHRSSFFEGRVALRFSYHLAEVMEKILVVEFVNPEFGRKDVEGLGEVEVAVFDDRIEIDPLYTNKRVLRAERVVIDWTHPDEADFLERMAQLNREIVRSQTEMAQAFNKIDTVLRFATELLRRTEIKAATSDELRSLNKSAVTVLRQIVNKLGEKPSR